jgi:hypothetical protein
MVRLSTGQAFWGVIPWQRMSPFLPRSKLYFETSVAVLDPDPYHFQDPTGRENLTKNTFCVGSVGTTDKENQVMMYKKYSFRYRLKR